MDSQAHSGTEDVGDVVSHLGSHLQSILTSRIVKLDPGTTNPLARPHSYTKLEEYLFIGCSLVPFLR